MTISTSLPQNPNQSSISLWESIWGVVQDRGLQAGDQLPSIRELADRLEVKQTAVRDAFIKAESQGLIKILPRAGAFLRAGPTTTSPIVPSTTTTHSVPYTPTGETASNRPTPPNESAVPFTVESTLQQVEHNLFHLLDARRLVEIELAGRAAERRRLEDLLPIRLALDSMLQIPADATRPEYVDQDIRFHVEIARLAGNLVLFTMHKTLMELLRPHLDHVPRNLERRSMTDRSHVAIYEALVQGNAEKVRTEMREHLSLAYDSLLQDVQAAPTVQAFGANRIDVP